MQEPRLDQHEWQIRWEALEPELADVPAEALPELARLVGEILAERGYDTGVDPENDRELTVGHEVVIRLDEAETLDPGAIAAAVNAYRNAPRS